EFLKRTSDARLWGAIGIETRDSPPPPVWSIASHAGKRVGVFDPVPYSSTPEHLNGFLADADDDGHYGIFWGDRTTPEDVEDVQVTARDPASIARARESASLAAMLFRRSRPDLAVYYTHFVDGAQHLGWDYTIGRGFFGGDPSPALDDRFDDTPIRRAYDA